MKKCLTWINLQLVSKDKCNNGTKRENSTGNLSIINRAYLPSKAKGISFSGMIKLKLKSFLKVCRVRSLKNINFIFLSF